VPKAGSIKALIRMATLLAAFAVHNARAQTAITPEQARTIAKEAYIYANPMVDSYRILYSYFVDRDDPDF
jgi:hypothetical protein